MAVGMSVVRAATLPLLILVPLLVYGVLVDAEKNTLKRKQQSPKPELSDNQRRVVVEEHALQSGRKYTLVMPPPDSDWTQQIGSMPLLVAAHCFGCVGTDLINFAKPAASYGFALVLPEEKSRHSGWNAVECCGESLRSGTDDLGFIREVVRDVVNRNLVVSSRAVFGTGWSNGGFLVTADALVAARSQQPQERIFHAIAPISGFQYDHVVDASSPPPPLTNHDNNNNNNNGGVRPSPAASLPVLMFHSLDDPIVRYEGCCHGGALRASGHCCCGIGAGRGSCVGTRAVFEAYARLNGCSEDEAFSSSLSSPPPFASSSSAAVAAAAAASTAQYYHDMGGFSCETKLGCTANTTLCSFPRGLGHFNGGAQGFQSAFPAGSLSEIGIFFAREACESLGHGEWVAVDDGGSSKESIRAPMFTCHCPTGRKGRYCLNGLP